MFNHLKSQLDQSVKTLKRVLDRPIQVTQNGVALGVSQSSMQEQMRDARRQRLHAMLNDVSTLLDRHPTTRQLMRHLDLVERTLRRRGLRGVAALPTRITAKAVTEMEQLVVDWSPKGLAELRSRMAIMVKNRPPEEEVGSLSTDMVELDMVSSAEVSEVDHSVFEEMERSWTGQMPLELSTAKY
jgi:hypothetical protein